MSGLLKLMRGTEPPPLPPLLLRSFPPSLLTRSMLNSSQKAGLPTRGAPKEYMCRRLVEQSLRSKGGG